MPGTVIRNYRELKNYSQKYVASKMGISQNAYSKIENNQTQLTVHHVKQLSEILQVPITDLLKDEFEIHKPAPMHKNITRAELLERVEALYNKINTRHAQKHEGYVVAISLINAADHAVSAIH